MRKVTIPATSIETSCLGFGTASLHHLTSRKARDNLLASVLDSGVTHFDTAPMYGEGMAERALGRFFGRKRQRVSIATKIGFPAIPLFESFPALMYASKAIGPVARHLASARWARRKRDLTELGAEKSLTRSLRALRTDWVELLLVHEPHGEDAEPLANLAEWLLRQKASGRVRYLGLAGSAAACLDITLKHPGLFDVLQVEDSIFSKDADIITEAGWPLQLTYGYLRTGAREQKVSDSIDELMDGAFARNRDGVVLVSTRNATRVTDLASCAD